MTKNRAMRPMSSRGHTIGTKRQTRPEDLGHKTCLQESQWMGSTVAASLLVFVASISCEPNTQDSSVTSENAVVSAVEMGAWLREKIESAEDGATIQLSPGTYTLTSPIEITKPVHLVGESGMFETVIDAEGAYAFRINAGGSGSSFQGITIQNATSRGIFAQGSLAAPVSNLRIQDCQFRHNRIGFFAIFAQGEINRNLWVDQTFRTMQFTGFKGEIANNTIVRSPGILGSILEGTKIHHNLIENNGDGPELAYGIVVNSGSPTVAVHDNLVLGHVRVRFEARGSISQEGTWLTNRAQTSPLPLMGPKYALQTIDTLGYGYPRPLIVDPKDPQGLSVSDAVAQAEDDATIVLKPGTHSLASAIKVAKPLSFIGESGMFETVIDTKDIYAFKIDAAGSGSSFQGVTVQNAKSSGIFVQGSLAVPVSNLKIQDCQFKNNRIGFFSTYAQGEINRNLWVDQTFRTMQFTGFKGEISNNTIVRSPGILGSILEGTKIHHNLIENNGESPELAYGITVSSISSLVQIHDNLVLGPVRRPFEMRGAISKDIVSLTNHHRSKPLSLSEPRYARHTIDTLDHGYAIPTVVYPNETKGLSLEDAIAEAKEGASIVLKAGTHILSEAISIAKPIHLLGESGMFETVVEAKGSSAFVVKSSAGGSSFQGLTIQKASNVGLYVQGTPSISLRGIEIQDCRFVGNRIGLFVRGAQAEVHHNLWVDQTYRGFQFSAFEGEIRNNTIVGSSGILGSVMAGTKVHHNIIYGKENDAALPLAIRVSSTTSENHVYDNVAFGNFLSLFQENYATPLNDGVRTNEHHLLPPVTLQGPKYADFSSLYPGHGYQEMDGSVSVCTKGAVMRAVLSPGAEVEPCSGFKIVVPANALPADTAVSLKFEADPASEQVRGKAVFSEGLVGILRMEPSMEFAEPLEFAVPVTLLGSESLGVEYLTFVVDDTHEPSIELREMDRSVIQLRVPHFSSMTIHDWSRLDADARGELLEWAADFYTFSRSPPPGEWPPEIWPSGRPFKEPTMVRSQGRGDGCNTGNWDLGMNNGSATGAHARFGRPNEIVIDGARVSHCVHAEFDESFSGQVVVRARQRNNVCDGALRCILYNEEQCSRQIGFSVFHAPYHSYNGYNYNLFKRVGDEQLLSRDFETFRYEVPESSRFVLVCRGDYGSQNMPMEIDSILTPPSVPCIKPYSSAACNKERPGYDCPATEAQIDDPNFCNSSSFDSDNFEHFGTCYRWVQSDADALMPLVRGQQCCYTDGWDNGSGSVDKTGTAKGKTADNSCRWTKNLGRVRKHCLEDVELVCRNTSDNVKEHCSCMAGCRFFDSRCSGLGFIPGLRF